MTDFLRVNGYLLADFFKKYREMEKKHKTVSETHNIFRIAVILLITSLRPTV